MPRTTKRTPKQLHETLATKYLFGWASNQTKAAALELALCRNAAALELDESRACQARARESRVMATRLRHQMDAAA